MLRPRGGCSLLISDDVQILQSAASFICGKSAASVRAVIWLEGMILQLNVSLTFVNRITSSPASAAFGNARLADVLFAVSLAAASSERWLRYSFASLSCSSAPSQVLTYSFLFFYFLLRVSYPSSSSLLLVGVFM